jgi:short-subunit dehydrogenase
MKNKFNEKTFITVLLLGSLFIRFLYLLLNIHHIYNDILTNPDSSNYTTIAKNLLEGNGFSLVPSHLTALFEPGYPIFISLIYLIFGKNFIFIIILQILLDSISCVLIYFFTKKLINTNVAILSSIIYMIYPDFIFASCQIIKEPLFLLLQITGLSLIREAEEKRKDILYIFAGVICGFATLTIGAFLIFPFLLFFYFLFKKEFKKYLIFILFFLLSLTPWTIRNYIIFRKFIPIISRTGFLFWMGNNKYSDGGWTWIKSEKMLYEVMSKEFSKDTTEIEMNTLGFKKAFEYLKSLTFKEFLILEIKKLFHLFDFRYYVIMYWYVILFPFAILGILINFLNNKNSLLYYIILTPIIIALIFYGDIRYRMPLLPYLNIFSAVGINFLFEKFFKFNKFDLPKKILIFGATSKIVFEIAKLFAKNGVSFYLCARDENSLKNISEDLLFSGAERVEYSTFDALDENSIKKCIENCLKEFPELDCVIIGYGMLPDKKLSETEPEIVKETINVNFLSVVLILTYISLHFENQNRGNIIVISSISGDRGRQSNYVYASSKGALSIFLEGLRQRLFKYGVQVLEVKPGFVDTPMTSNYKKNFLFASPAKVARDVYKAVKKRKDVIYTPWFWRWIMMIIRNIPEIIFKRMRL